MSQDYKTPTTAPTNEPLQEPPEVTEMRVKAMIEKTAQAEARQWVKDSTPTPPKEGQK